MLAFEPHAEGIVLVIRAQPGARRNEIRLQNDTLKVCVTQQPEKGKANKAIIELLCKILKLKKSQIALLAGDTAQQKRFLFRKIDAATLAERIRLGVKMEDKEA